MILIMEINHYQKLFLKFSDYQASDWRINLNFVYFNFSYKLVKILGWGLDGKIESDFMPNQELKIAHK